MLCMAPIKQAADGPEPDRQGGRGSEPEGLEGSFGGLPPSRVMHSIRTAMGVMTVL